jgi:hypothetical protein
MAPSLRTLKVAEDDNESLKATLAKQRRCARKSQEELNYKSARVADLEQQCKDKSAKSPSFWNAS